MLPYYETTKNVRWIYVITILGCILYCTDNCQVLNFPQFLPLILKYFVFKA